MNRRLIRQLFVAIFLTVVNCRVLFLQFDRYSKILVLFACFAMDGTRDNAACLHHHVGFVNFHRRVFCNAMAKHAGGHPPCLVTLMSLPVPY